MKTEHINKMEYNKPESGIAKTSLDTKIPCSPIKISYVVTPTNSYIGNESNNKLSNKSFLRKREAYTATKTN